MVDGGGEKNENEMKLQKYFFLLIMTKSYF